MTINQSPLSIVCFSGEFDKALAAFTLANGGAAMGREVNMFFTFWGLNLLKKNVGRNALGQSLLARFFNWLLGGKHVLPLSRLNFAGMSPVLMKGMMKKNGVASLDELMTSASELGVNLIACEMAMEILEIKKSDLVDEVKEIIGVATFLDASKEAQIIFI